MTDALVPVVEMPAAAAEATLRRGGRGARPSSRCRG